MKFVRGDKSIENGKDALTASIEKEKRENFFV